MRKVPFVRGEFYHIYNRGVDKRKIFSDQDDIDRFFQSMKEFNVLEPIGSIYENSFRKEKTSLGDRTSKLVNVICYCLNSNHYHIILEQVSDKGIEKFMQRMGTGYTRYFNDRHKRSGVLFQGKFKAVHVNSNEYLLHLSAYVNLNNRIHQLGGSTPKLMKSSWEEYVSGDKSVRDNSNFCNKDIILGQFKNALEYKKFAEESLEGIVEGRKEDKNLGGLLLE